MDTVRETGRDVPVVADVDLCVVGGSCTGVFAAVTAARLGLRAAVVEAHGFFGGVAAAGLVNIWHATLDTEFRRTIIGGLTAETVDRLRRRNAVVEQTPSDRAHYVLNTEELKVELDELVTEAGVRPFLHARFVDVAGEGGAPQAAIIEDKSGRRAIRARVFIDASGDGDLANRAGLPLETWPDLQPPTTCAIIRGIETIRRRHPAFRLDEFIFQPGREADLPHGFLWSSLCTGHPEDVMVAGTRAAGADCADADQLTRAEIEGRRQVRVMCDLLRRHRDGGDRVALVQLPAAIGVRETRHAACLHRLTESEVLGGVRFGDAVANGSYRVDVHHSDKPGLTFRYLDGREVYVVPGREPVRGRWRPARDADPTFYQIPYRSLVPRGAANVLVAGRLIDADRGAYGAARVMVNCNQTGEAAGAAAQVALDSGAAVADVDTEALRRTLARQGAVII
jgi:hypothetical protein